MIIITIALTTDVDEYSKIVNPIFLRRYAAVP